MDVLGDPVLIIPTLFYSWKGHALDRKIPLLRSIEAVKKTTLKLFGVCGLHQHTSVHTDSGIEQEFFLLDAAQASARPDIQLSGRTLQGRHPAKGQELSDSYFGIMTQKVLKCILEMEEECWKLGIPITTRHREVCPNQYELAPIFQKSAVASDQNIMLMQVMDAVAKRHGLMALFHEKPFTHVNGSGKTQQLVGGHQRDWHTLCSRQGATRESRISVGSGCSDARGGHAPRVAALVHQRRLQRPSPGRPRGALRP